ncbi:hypothetical protein K435DRAFT_790681 [Dendrothele bispora CBS 962.96]|uniref:Uncharacterized protein n=1 Tax=Dendrothele bispora (strain CBS 962.96) TaxID=1314807 RepID=A0A4S8MPP3_DENBC|nr:hypothetical protein K435DRAFT_790681 [Dendrothele bispora CBS 962.96]
MIYSGTEIFPTVKVVEMVCIDDGLRAHGKLLKDPERMVSTQFVLEGIIKRATSVSKRLRTSATVDFHSRTILGRSSSTLSQEKPNKESTLEVDVGPLSDVSSTQKKHFTTVLRPFLDVLTPPKRRYIGYAKGQAFSIDGGNIDEHELEEAPCLVLNKTKEDKNKGMGWEEEKVVKEGGEKDEGRNGRQREDGDMIPPERNDVGLFGSEQEGQAAGIKPMTTVDFYLSPYPRKLKSSDSFSLFDFCFSVTFLCLPYNANENVRSFRDMQNAMQMTLLLGRAMYGQVTDIRLNMCKLFLRWFADAQTAPST